MDNMIPGIEMPVSRSSPTQVLYQQDDTEGDQRTRREHLDEQTRSDRFEMPCWGLRSRPHFDRPGKTRFGASIRDEDPDDVGPDVRAVEHVRRRRTADRQPVDEPRIRQEIAA